MDKENKCLREGCEREAAYYGAQAPHCQEHAFATAGVEWVGCADLSCDRWAKPTPGAARSLCAQHGGEDYGPGSHEENP